MKRQLCVLIDSTKKNFGIFNKKTYEGFFRELKYLNIIDIGRIIKDKTEDKIYPINDNFKILRPKNLNELDIIFKENNFIIFYDLTHQLKYFKINSILLKNNIEKFYISNLGYNPENFNYKNNNIIQKFNNFIAFRLNYYLMRFLVLIKLWPKIDYFFESSSYIINSINSGLSKKIHNLTNVNFSFYSNVIKINSRSFDNSVYLKEEISEDYIVYIDFGWFDHPDITLRERGINNFDRSKKYYKNLYEFLSKLKDLYNKKIIVCLHPKNYTSEKMNHFKDLECVKFKTEKMINRAFIVIYHEGSSIMQAFLLKKKIINLHAEYLGNYINKRSSLYSDLLNIKKIDLEKFEIHNKIDFLANLEKSTKNYDAYIEKNLVNDKSKTGIQQIVDYLKLR